MVRERADKMMQGLGESILLDSDDIFVAPGPLSIRAERVLASYNKVGDNAIAVPGCPPQFTPPNARLHVHKVLEEPVYPTITFGLEPLVRAVQCMSPNVDVLGGACDIVSNAGSLYKLFLFLENNLSFTARMDMEWQPSSKDETKGVMLVQSWKGDPSSQFSVGYGGRFTEATCHFPKDLPETLQNSYSHHRVLYYELGGLRMAVHCEADGYYSPELPPSPPVSPKLSKAVPASKGSRFSVLMVDDDDPVSEELPVVSSDTLAVTFPCGPATPVPAANLVEIKTFDARKVNCKHDVCTDAKFKLFIRHTPDSQLYFGRTLQLYEAGHDSGVFSGGLSVNNVTARLQQWEADNQKELGRLVGFLQRICTLAAEHASRGNTRLSLILPGTQHCDPVKLAHLDRSAKLYVRTDGVAFLPESL
ncbi:hypothetical protein SBRCBS47491_002167 [Sporothrix bragantina]|uniref:Uncharacterized protein n=1 Tax=Sporothrix bragantina TaxID=671064 RepID=A0ABP0B4Q0_9PEZI